MSAYSSFRIAICAALLAMGPLLPASNVAAAQSAAAQTVRLGPSGLPLPRFVSLKSDRVNSRIGPGLKYSVDWMYLKAGLPMEIIQEYDNWRRVRDSEGSEGWINQSLLSGHRTGMAAPWQRDKDTRLELRADPEDDAAIVANLEPGVVGKIDKCDGEWCRMSFKGHTGWLKQALVWGAYPGEKIDE